MAMEGDSKIRNKEIRVQESEISQYGEKAPRLALGA
jgi:hypothetical protein